ncbi:unnamed protein product [Victoria cruziana]
MDVVKNPRPLVEASVNDQRFLLNFIMGTYLGPDVKTDVPRRSAFQRVAEGLPHYYSTDLGEAFLKLSDVECLYYYVLRNAHPSAVLRVHSLYQYFKGQLPPPVLESLDDDRQFTTLFPPGIHKQGRYKGSFKIFKGIIFFDNPNTSYISPSDLQRFKWLTGLDDLSIDRKEAQLYRHGYRTDRDESQQMPNYAMVMETPKDLPNGNAAAAARRRISNQRRRLRVALQMQLPPPPRTDLPNYVSIDSFSEEEMPVQSPHPSGPSVLLLSSSSSVENWNFDSTIILTGTAKEGRAGPPVGLVDIGTSKDAYLFRISLPGVKKDARQFSCEIEYDGKVVIKGVTSTGESTIMRNSRVFYMKTHHLCPPGPFSISFYLPGPVDPRLFSGNFGSDGILEAIVKKYREPTGTSTKVRP